jgi:hypothetical protein
VPFWGACGGLSSTPARAHAADPSYCCEAGSTCTFKNEYYWQCVPTAATSTSSTSSTGTRHAAARCPYSARNIDTRLCRRTVGTTSSTSTTSSITTTNTFGSVSAIARCVGSTKLVLYVQQALSQDAASSFCRAQHGPSAYLPSQGAALEVAQALVQSAQVGC